MATHYPAIRDIIRKASRNKKLTLNQDGQAEKLNEPNQLLHKKDRVTRQMDDQSLQTVTTQIQLIEQQGDANQLLEWRNKLQSHITSIDRKLSCQLDSKETSQVESKQSGVTSQPALFSVSSQQITQRKVAATVEDKSRYSYFG